jgi:hypothetical protein
MDNDLMACEAFLDELHGYLIDYEKALLLQVKKPTVQKHIVVLKLWTEFICLYHSLTDFSGLSVALVNSTFFAYFKSYNEDDLTPIATSNIVKRFLLFVYDKYGIANADVMRKLKLL